MQTFYERVWGLMKRIPCGRVTTYKELAKALGSKAYRAVGNACHNNPHAPVVPCHRVVNSNGCIGGFASGTKKKIRMLRQEGVQVQNGKIVGFEKVLFKFR